MSEELAGRLRERLTIERGSVRNDAGAAAGDPVVGIPMWAAVRAEQPARGVDAERIASLPRYRVTMRASAAAVGDTLRWKGQALRVLAVTHDPVEPDRVSILAEVMP